MADPNASPIAPAPAVSATSPTSDAPGTPTERLARMSPAERSTWRNTGEVPGTSAPGDGDPGDADAVEDHSVEPAEPRTERAAPGAPSADVSAAGRTLAKGKQTAQQRINDLARKNYTLEGELNALRRQLAPSSRPAAAAETPPVAAPSRAPASAPDPDEPQEDDFATYKEYVAAAADYRIKLARTADQAERVTQERVAEFRTLASAHDARLDAFAAAHPDFHEVIANQTEVYPSPLLADAVLRSDLSAELAYHLNTHVEEYRALVNLAPGLMLKALGRLESRLEAAGPAAAPTQNRISRAPAPPTTLGTRPATPGDSADAAGARGDVAAYMREENARELAARR